MLNLHHTRVPMLVNDKRVQLKPVTKIPGSNYINASFIDVSTKIDIILCIVIHMYMYSYIGL